MDYSELVARLRNIASECVALGYASLRHNYAQAADALEAQGRRLAEVEIQRDNFREAALQNKGLVEWNRARLAEAEALLRKCRGEIEAQDRYLEQLCPRQDAMKGAAHPALADIDAFLGRMP